MSDSSGEITVVTFLLNQDLFGIEIHQIKEILRMPPVFHVPNAPSFIEGIINLRGTVVCVMDLHKRFNVPSEFHEKHKRIIIVELQERTLGLIVDNVKQVEHISLSSVAPVPPEIASFNTRFLKGVAKKKDCFIMLLDVEKMLSTEELLALNTEDPKKT